MRYVAIMDDGCNEARTPGAGDGQCRRIYRLTSLVPGGRSALARCDQCGEMKANTGPGDGRGRRYLTGNKDII
jgi:hypothetical protein